MALLNTADDVRLGNQSVDAVYAGTTKVWPTAVDPLPAGRLAWYDMTSLSAIPTGTVITAWPDGSGNDMDLTPVFAGNAPTYMSNAGDGHPGLVFPDGNNRKMASAHNTGLFGSAPWTQVIVLKYVAGTENITGIGTPGARQMTDLAGYGGHLIGHMYGGGNDTIGYGPPVLPADGAFHVAAATYATPPVDGGTVGGLLTRIDATWATSAWTGVMSLVNAPYLVGGGNYDPLGALGGGAVLRGVALYNRVLTSAEIDAVAAALSHPPVEPPFTPAAIPRLRCWLDCRTLADGPVATWVDRSSSGLVAAQANVANQPSKGQAVDGTPGVHFSQSGPYFVDIAGLGPILSGLTDYTTIFRIWPTEYASSPVVLSGPAGGLWQWLFELEGGNGVYWGSTNGQYRYHRFTTPTLGQWWTVSAVDGATAARMFVNGTEATTIFTSGSGDMITPIPNLGSLVRLGAYNNNLGITGHISDVLVYDRALTDAERIQVEDYLNDPARSL